MAGVVKDVVVSTLAPATTLSGPFDGVVFTPGFVLLFSEATSSYFAYSWANANVQKVVISPIGIAYPGDAVAGEGSNKLTIDFLGAPATVVMTMVEFATNSGWLVITKGDHLIAYNPSVIDNFIVEPS